MGTGFFSKSRKDQLAAFAEMLALHDASTGDPGGDLTNVAKKLGMSLVAAEFMLERLCRDLGESI